MSAPDFPSPPGANGLGSYATLAAQDDYYASPDQQAREAAYPRRQTTADATLAPEREAAAEEAIVDSLRHVVTAYARQAVSESFEEFNGEGTPAQLGDIEFMPTGRLVNDLACAVVFGLTMVAILPIMTQVVTVSICGGAVLTYVLDFLGHRRATMYSMAATLVVGWLTFYFANFADAWRSPSAMLIVISVALLFVLVGIRGVLAFKHIQTESPGFALLAEAMINSALPMVASPPLIAGLVGVVGARYAPFALVPVMCAVHYAFYLPMQSSFLDIATDVRRTSAEHLVLLMGPFEAAVGTVFTTFLPVILFPALADDALQLSPLNLCNFLFLLCAPGLYLVAKDPKATLWFLRSRTWGETSLDVDRSVDDEEAGGGNGTSRAITVRITYLDVVVRFRWILGFLFYSGVLHFAVERAVNSRFAYLIVGVPPPFNYILMLVAGYLGSVVIGCALALAFADGTAKEKKSKTSAKHEAIMWLVALLGSVVGAVAVGVVVGMPPFFIPMMALSAACFVAYMIDRRATNNFVTFMCATTITLTWWMFRTFSFIRQDLRVIGDKFTVSTSEVAGAVLLAYILGGAAIPLSYSQSKGPLMVVLVLHGLKISFLEHVLYSQPEQSAYPPIFVVATSAIGIFVASRLYKNEVLPDILSAYIMGLYASKFFVFLVQINVAGNEDQAYASEMFITELFSMAACAVLCIAELRHRAQSNMTTAQLMSVIVSWFIVLAGGMRDTVLRIVVEWLGFVRPSFVQLTAASAVACALFGYAIAGRYSTKVLPTDATDEQRVAVQAAADVRNKLRKWMAYTLVGAATLLIIDPSLEELITGEGTESISDNPFIAPWYSRWAVAAVLGLVYLGARVPLQRIHPLVRGAYFIGASVLLAVAATPLVIPASDFRVVAALSVFLATAAATVVACHHGRFEADVCLIMYLVSLVALALGFISLNYVDVSATVGDVSGGRLPALEAEAHALSRMGMLSIGSATNLAVALCLKLYLNGKPLLSGARPLGDGSGMGSQVALVCNYAVIIAFTTLSLLAYWVVAESSAMLVAAAPMLLLLHNDGVLMVRLNKGPFRYFPPFVAACATLGWHVQHEAHDLYMAGRHRRSALVLVGLLMLIPSHTAIARFLWSPKKRKTTVGRILIFVALDSVLLLATPSHGVRWLCVVGICALVGRLGVSGHWKPLADIAAM